MSGAILPERGDDLLGDVLVLAPGAVDQLHALHASHPGELAPSVGAVGRLDGLDVAREQLLEAQRGPGGAGSPGSRRRASLIRRAGGDHLVDSGVDSPSELLAI